MDRRYLTIADVAEIRALPRPNGRSKKGVRAPNGLQALAEKYGVSKTTISEARSGRKWGQLEPAPEREEMPDEEWRNAVGWEGLYHVSSAGRIWSVRLKRLLTPNSNAGGYLVVSLHRGGKKTNRLVHRMVADAFLAADPERPRVKPYRRPEAEQLRREPRMVHGP